MPNDVLAAEDEMLLVSHSSSALTQHALSRRKKKEQNKHPVVVNASEIHQLCLALSFPPPISGAATHPRRRRDRWSYVPLGQATSQL